MLFNAVEFIFVFLPAVLLVFYIAGYFGRYRLAVAWLVIASLFFYGWWNPVYLLLISGSIIFNYVISLLLCSKGKKAGLLLATGIAVNLIALCYFKYANFLVDALNTVTNSGYQLEAILLPLAISFFTFQQIAYLVDVYQGKTEEHHFLHYCLFVTFFPQLIAGPIVHHKEMIPQFSKRSIYSCRFSNLGAGLAIFFLGLFKKVVMADGLATYVDPTFAAAEYGVTITFFEAWSAALAYTFQLYFDFSGYCDMAVGIARMFNITLPLNFYSPYKAVNIIEFWKRWHMTLARFLREYLYIPLGGNRKGEPRRFVNIIVTMLLGGLWHGASWTFVAWGVLHGVYLMINHGWHIVRRAYGGAPNDSHLPGLWSGRAITFTAVVLAWVLFRADTFSGAMNVCEGMLGLHGFVLPEQVVGLLPWVSAWVATVGTQPLLGGGTIMGVVEMAGLIALSFVLICFPACHEMSDRLRLAALTVSFYFTIQAVLFGHVASEFLYFQF